jgi:protein-S-isoprenylcysteine O-methyltransferase Ste14
MRPLIFDTRGYVIAFAVAVALWAIPERVGSFWWRSSRDRSARKQDRGSIFLVLGSIFAGVLVGFAGARLWTGAAVPWFRPQLTIAGIVLILLGAALRWWAIITLGRYFTLDVAVRPAQKVVQSGPFRFVRHPSYTGLMLIFLGIGLALANWVSIIALLAGVLLGLLYRVQVEERALTQALGQPYVEYMRHTKRFIPFLV